MPHPPQQGEEGFVSPGSYSDLFQALEFSMESLGFVRLAAEASDRADSAQRLMTELFEASQAVLLLLLQFLSGFSFINHTSSFSILFLEYAILVSRLTLW